MKITWRPGAVLDLEAIETYIERDKPGTAAMLSVQCGGKASQLALTR